MMAPRKGLLSNLNHVHLQHVSLGVHLSLKAELIKDPDMETITGSHQSWNQETDRTQVDLNSNDPSAPCLCCDEHSKQLGTCNNNSQSNQEPITSDDEVLSPRDLPLSPLSPSSPSSHSSSSSDFTLDDSPVSMYYKEFSQEGQDSPDQQPDIIPLDAVSADSMWLSSECASPPLGFGEMRPNTPEPNSPEICDHMPTVWDTHAGLDANCNTLPEDQTLIRTDLLYECLNCDTVQGEEKVTTPDVRSDNSNKSMKTNYGELPSTPWALEEEEELLPGLSFPRDTSSQSHKNTKTSFHELAQRRRRSGGGQTATLVKKDKSDWLIMFSPDMEQPPVNELTATAFYQGSLGSCTQLLPVGKEVTTFRELRYRNNMIKQCIQQRKKQTLEEKVPQNAAPGVKEKYCATVEREALQCVTSEGKDIHYPALVKEEVQYQEESQLRPNHQTDKEMEPSVQPATQAEQPDSNGRWPVHTLFPVLVDNMSERWWHKMGHNQDISQEDLNSSQERRQLRREPVRVTSRIWMRGTADGGDKKWRDAGPCKLLMADSGEDHIQRTKKGLLIFISSSVDKIICHFNSSRNLVQKAQLGDSRLSPELGYLILSGLCASLYALLRDGMRPFQKDVIMGRRRLSPWSLVEASIKAGASPESLHTLLGTVSRLSQLRDTQRRFNAFIFGLLNTKQLDLWVTHLHQSYALFSMFFVPTGFLALASSTHPELYDELLLTLQPLSALTFHLDLLFEHHHLPLSDSPVSPQPLIHGQRGLDTWGRSSLQHLLHWGGRLAQNLALSATQDQFTASRNDPSILLRGSSQESSCVNNGTSHLPQNASQSSYCFHGDIPQDSSSFQEIQQGSSSLREVPQESIVLHDPSSLREIQQDSGVPQDSSSSLREIQQDSGVPQDSSSSLREIQQDSGVPQDSSSSLREIQQDSGVPQDSSSSLREIQQDSGVPRDSSSSLRELSQDSGVPQDSSSSLREIQQDSGVPRDSSSSLRELSQDSGVPHDSSSSLRELSQDSGVPQDSSSSPVDLFSPSINISQDSVSHLMDHTQGLLSARSRTPQDCSSSWWGHLSQASRVYLPTKIDSFPFTNWSKIMSRSTHESEQGKTPVRGEEDEWSTKRADGVFQTLPEGEPQDSVQTVDSLKYIAQMGGDITNKDCPSYSDNTKAGEIFPNTEGWDMWLGHLFGANSISTRGTETRNIKRRRPSSWLRPSVKVFEVVRKTSIKDPTNILPQNAEEHQSSRKTERSLRALCDHATSDQAQLSFRRGDVLQLLSTVDEDWIRCRHGSAIGLVPVGYTSLIL